MVILLVTGPIGSEKGNFAEILKTKYGYNVYRLKSVDYKRMWDFENNRPIADAHQEIIEETKELIKVALHFWKEDSIIYPVLFPESVEQITKKRSYFKIIGINAPLEKRFASFTSKNEAHIGQFSKDNFIALDDHISFKVGVAECLASAEFQIMNTDKKEDFEKKIEGHDLITKKIFRPSWDLYFMKLAHIVRERSNCMKRSVGAIVVQGNRIVSTGYNGTPGPLTNCFEGGCERCNQNKSQGVDLDKCNCIHAEENSILECGVHRAKGATVYTTLSPCRWCTKVLISAQVKRVVYDEKYSDRGTDALFEKAGIIVDCVSIDI